MDAKDSMPSVVRQEKILYDVTHTNRYERESGEGERGEGKERGRVGEREGGRERQRQRQRSAKESDSITTVLEVLHQEQRPRREGLGQVQQQCSGGHRRNCGTCPLRRNCRTCPLLEVRW